MPGPPPPVAAVRHAVRADLAHLADGGHLADLSDGLDLPDDGPAGARPEGGTLVLVACSGGSDSTALAAGLAHVAPRLGLRAGLVHVDHGLDPQAVQRSQATAALGERLGLSPIEVVRVDVDEGGGPEDAARRARHTALEAVARRTGAAAVLLAHTRDDQAETVLLRLARGSGARSLAGIPRHRGLLRRPLLGLRRSLLRDACRAQGLAWSEDPANDDVDLARVRVRTAALPALVAALGDGVTEGLARTADLLRDDADLLEAQARDLQAAAVRAASRGTVARDAARRHVAGAVSAGPVELDAAVLDAAVLAAAPAALRRRVLRAAALAAGSPAGRLGLRHVEALDALVVAWHGQGPVALPGGVAAVRRSGTLVLETAGRAPTARGPQEPEAPCSPRPPP